MKFLFLLLASLVLATAASPAAAEPKKDAEHRVADATDDASEESAGEQDSKKALARVAAAPQFPGDPAAVAESGVGAEGDDQGVGPVVAIDSDTWFELHGYARMPIAVQTTPREPFLIDNDYFLSGFAYTRLYEPDWSEIFLSAHHKTYQVKFGMFASLYSDYAAPELENQFGIAQASVAAEKFLGYDELSVELGVFWDRFGYIEPYDTYLFGRTHQGGMKARWNFSGQGSNRAYVQAGIGVRQQQLQQNQGLTPVAHLVGGIPLPGGVTLGGYLLKVWTRDKRQLSPIEDGDLSVAGIDANVELPRGYGKGYAALSYIKATKALFLAPALEVLHSTGGRGLTENYLGLDSSENGTGALLTFALDAPLTLSDKADVRVFGMATWVTSKQTDAMDPAINKDRRMYLKWGVEPGYLVSKRGVRVGVRYDRIIMDLYDSANSFRVLSPKVSFPLDKWGELIFMYSRYWYGDKIQLRPGQVPLETEPDTNVLKVQAQAVW